MSWILIFLSSSRHCSSLQCNSNIDKRDSCEKYSLHPWNDIDLCYLHSSPVKLSTWKLAARVLHHIRFFLSWKKRCNWPLCGKKITFIIFKRSLLIFQFYSQSTERQIFCASFVAFVMCSQTSKMFCCISPQNRKDFSLIDFYFGVNFFPI